jgi:hypothetical protein
MQELMWDEETTETPADIVSRLQRTAGMRPGWSVVDASTFTPEELEAALMSARAPGPLRTAWLIRRDARRHELQWYLHHVIADGWPIDVLLQEVLSILKAKDHVPPRPSQ